MKRNNMTESYDPFIMRHQIDNAVAALNSLVLYAREVLPTHSGLRGVIEEADHIINGCQDHLAAVDYSEWIGIEGGIADRARKVLEVAESGDYNPGEDVDMDDVLLGNAVEVARYLVRVFDADDHEVGGMPDNHRLKKALAKIAKNR